MNTTLALQPLPADPLLGLMAAFREDSRRGKIDLGVGVYRDESGRTPIMKAVSDAEILLSATQDTKAYESPRGNTSFCEEIERLLLDEALGELKSRICSFTTPGGCGAIYLGMQLVKRASKAPTVWISDPSWPNHRHVACRADLNVQTYRYLDQNRAGIDFDALLEDLSSARRGDLVIIQGPCHNPSGIDLDASQWILLRNLAMKIGFVPMIDIAYHGLGSGPDEDLTGIRKALASLPEAVVTYSCSKNFGLYRERTGCLIVLAETDARANSLSTHLADISRACYSMPPAHGAALVDLVLSNVDAKDVWRQELKVMRTRIQTARRTLADALSSEMQDDRFQRIANEKGMFSLLPISNDAAQRLVDSFAIYMPGSGRINMAGIPPGAAEGIARAVNLAQQGS